LLSENKNFVFRKVDIKNKKAVDRIFETYRPSYVINLAAQAECVIPLKILCLRGFKFGRICEHS